MANPWIYRGLNGGGVSGQSKKGIAKEGKDTNIELRPKVSGQPRSDPGVDLLLPL